MVKFRKEIKMERPGKLQLVFTVIVSTFPNE